MDGGVWLAVWLIILISFSAFFSSTETAFSAFNRIRVKNLASEGDKRASIALKLSENYDRLLSSLLIGNNIVNIAASSIATVFFVQIFGNNMGPTISTVVMTILILIFGEISPKSIAKESPEKVALNFAKPMSVICVIFTPLNFLFSQWKKLLNKVFKSTEDKGITEQELLTIVDEAQNEGGFDSHEGDLIKSAIEFKDLDAEDILTPRIDVTAFDLAQSKDALINLFIESGYSRLPVYRDSVDNIVGVVHQKDLFASLYDDRKSVEDIIKPVVFISPSMKISKLIKRLQGTKTHFAVVTDEYGGTVGIITLEDILEELVGEIWDEHDEVVEEFKQISDNVYEILGSANSDVLDDELGIELEDDDDYNTISGWVMDRLEKLPVVGDSFSYENCDVVVTEMDGRRVSKIRITVSEPEPVEEDKQD